MDHICAFLGSHNVFCVWLVGLVLKIEAVSSVKKNSRAGKLA